MTETPVGGPINPTPDASEKNIPESKNPKVYAHDPLNKDELYDSNDPRRTDGFGNVDALVKQKEEEKDENLET